jgi:transcription initiation factor TFIID TATA-box-binding protein
MTRIRIENVVASTSLGGELDLSSIALALPGAEYEPTQFPGLIYRMMEPKTAILLFHSGKVVCTGGKSWKQVDDSVRTVAELVRKQGQKTLKHPKIEVQNIVATSDLGSEINLNTIAITLGLDHVEYEPEQFPGLVCRLDDPRVVVLLFGSGKLVCTGARRPADLERAVQSITKALRGAGLLGEERAREGPEAIHSSRRNQPTTVAAAPPSPTEDLGPPPEIVA